MNLDYDFVQVSTLSEGKEKVLTKNETLFPQIQVKTKKEKKGRHQEWNTFFSRIQVDTYAQMLTRVKLLGECRCRPFSNYWGGYSQIIAGGYIPPAFGTPVHSNSGTLRLEKRQLQQQRNPNRSHVKSLVVG